MKNLQCLTNIPPNQLIFFETLLSVVISDDLNPIDLGALGTTFLTIGTLLANKAAVLASQQAKDDVKQQIQDLEKQIQKLKEKI
jgi:hypothetical protein